MSTRTTRAASGKIQADAPKTVDEVPSSSKRKASDANELTQGSNLRLKVGASQTFETAAKLKIGDVLPDVSLKDDEGKELKITEIGKERGAVIFSYPKANTGGCTTQACGFRDNYDSFVTSGYEIYGISVDSVTSLASWKKKQGFQYPLLSDPNGLLLRPLGAYKGKGQGAQRSHWIVAKGGRLTNVSLGVKPKDSFTDSLAQVQKDSQK